MEKVKAVAPFLILSLLCAVIFPTIKGEGTQTRSLTSLWPTLYKLMQSDTRSAACFFMRTPPSECFEGKIYPGAHDQKRSGEINNVQDLLEETEESLCDGKPCRRRFSEDYSRDEPLAGPKRFYNNW